DRERHAKIKPPDPLTADSRITLAGQSTDWTLNTFLEENVVELEVSVDKETETELVLENRGRWAVKNNGVFLHRIHFEKLTTRVVSRSTKPGGSTSKGMTEVRGGTAVLQQSIQPIQAEVNALQVEVEQKGEAQWQQKQLFTIPFSGQNSRINLTFLKEATVKMVEEETRKGGVVKPKSAKKWPFAVLKAKDVKTAVPELKPLGTDVYFGTGDHINWAELKKNGVEFTFLRVGSGVTEQDGNYERNVRLCLENDIPFGNYFFLYEKGFVTAKTKRKAIDARAQARRFAEQSDWRSTLPPVVDVERHNLTVAEIKAFVDEFHQLVDAPPIMIYTRANLWNKLVPKAATWPQKHPLWVAHYGTDTPSLPHHWDRCLFHQFSETQRFQGHPNNLDGNVFFGKAEELKLGKETAVVPHAERGEGMEEKEEKIADNPLDKLETRHADMTLLDVAHVTQRENGLWKDCGPACIAMLTGIPLVKALKQSKQQKNKALGFGHLIIALEANEVTAKRVENLRAERVRRFVKQGKPVILLINYHQMPKIKQQLGRSFNSKTKKWNTEFDHFVVAVGADDKGIYIHDPLGFASDKRPGGGYFTFLTDSDLHKTMSSMSWAGNPTYKGLLIDKKFRQLLANDLTSCYVHQDYVKLKGGLAVTIGSPKMRSEPREEPTTYMQKAIRQNRAVLLLKKEVENGYLAIRTAVKGIWPATKTNKIDMTRYFFPPNDEPMGEIYLLKNSWNGGQERVQLQRQGDVSYVVKNAKYEKRAIRNGKIYLEVDTSPGTDASGQDRYYTVDSETGWMPQKMAVGERFMRREMVTYYHKHNGHQITQNHAKSDLLFVKHHDSWTSHGDRTLNDVVELAWEVIKGDGSTYIDERYFFAAGYGLVGWEKHSGEKSWITNENTAGQSNNKMEQISFL
ncbi:MAG: GH25 family lysozyme, partial [Chloroflexota bacterium]